MFLVLKIVFLKPLQNLQEITYNGEWLQSNGAGVALLKSLSAMNTQRILTFFLKERLGKIVEATCTCFNTMALHFKIHRCIQHPVKHIRCFFRKLIVRCLAGFRIPLLKKTFKVLSFVNPSIKFVILLYSFKRWCYNGNFLLKLPLYHTFFLVERANKQERDQLDIFNRLIEIWTEHDEPIFIQSL